MVLISPPSTNSSSILSITLVDSSPKSMEKHCRPIDTVMIETEIKGNLIDKLHQVEDRLLKLCIDLEVHEREKDKIQQQEFGEEGKKDKKECNKGLKQLVHMAETRYMTIGNTLIVDPMFYEVEIVGYGTGFPFHSMNMNLQGSELVVKNMDAKLFEAVTSGNVDLLETLIEQNIEILQQVTPMRDTCMHIAAGLGHLEIVKSIHRRCQTLFTKANKIGDTSLHRAAKAGHFHIVEFLIQCARHSPRLPSRDIEIGREEAFDIIRKQNQDNDTVMHEAVRYPHFEMVKLLIKEDPELLCMVNCVGESPLYMAAGKGDFNIVEQILENNLFSCKGLNGRTALHAAIIHEHSDITKLLLNKKPELVKETDDNGRTPLHFASGLGYLNLVQMLLIHDTSVTCLLDKTGSAPIHIAAHFGRVPIIQEFIRGQPDLIDLLDERCRNMLHIAIDHQQVSTVKYMLREQWVVGLLNGKAKDGSTPLHRAVISGNPYIANILLKDKRVNLMVLNRKGYSAVDIAWSERKKQGETCMREQALLLATLVHAAASSPWNGHHLSFQRSISKEDIIIFAESSESFKQKADALLIVATLVATVTFAAGFTLPGGYQSDGQYKGMATLQNLKQFNEFVTIDALGMYSSVGAVVMLIWLHFVMNVRTMPIIFLIAQFLTSFSVVSMTRAFISAVNLTTSERETIMYPMLLEVENAGYATGQPVQGMILDVGSPVLEITNMDPELFEAVTLGKSIFSMLSTSYWALTRVQLFLYNTIT
ncbi:Ankyrin repeat-containing protein [Thalictrum thalictroides]|uniref:Ankyrin repeat-containing protein n=1 Tax=Thalictrum thalictroides TaxID=46969 RepID=A0A7J6VJV5_THATH|nr:Ankyrin repeat-containing protein [Thalictrum thalictroides]